MVFDKVVALIAEELGVDASKITLDTNLVDDLGADSLDAVELVMAIEDEFGIEVADEDAQSIKTVADIVKILEK